MAKRFATVFFIMVGVVIFLLSAFVLVLFLAPGARIFGLKYIAVDTHAVSTGKIKISQQLFSQTGSSEFSNSIIVSTGEVPVIVEFTSAGTDYYYAYYDNYSGLTKSDIISPSVELSRNENGDAILTVSSFDSFIYQNANSQRYIKLFVPLANISVTDYQGKPPFVYGDSDPGASLKYQTNLTIISNSGEVHFAKGDASRVPTFDTVTVKTSGAVVHNNCQVKALNFIYETDKTIRVSADIQNLVNAKNYDLTSRNGGVIVSRELSGDLVANTKNGDVELYVCKNFTATTDLGDIKSSFDGREVHVKGNANIKTVAGSVKIKRIDGDGQNLIETGSGSVDIDIVKSATISTHRGAVNIKSANLLTVSTNTGNVTVESATSGIDVSTKRGKIRLGAEGMVLNSPKVSTHLGKVWLTNTSGEVYVETISSDVTIANGTSENIEIKAGGDLVATNLKGSVAITAGKIAFLEFSKVSNDVNILLEKTCTYVKIEALSTKRTDLHYSIAGRPATLYEANNTGHATYSLIETGDYLTNQGAGPFPTTKFQVVGDNVDGSAEAKVDLYFNKSSSSDY